MTAVRRVDLRRQNAIISGALNIETAQLVEPSQSVDENEENKWNDQKLYVRKMCLSERRVLCLVVHIEWFLGLRWRICVDL